MLVNRERNYTFEELCDKYLYLVDSASEEFGLDEDQKQDLVVLLCEYLQNRVSKGAPVTYPRVRSMVRNSAKKLVRCRDEHLDCETSAVECSVYVIDLVEDRVMEEQLCSAVSQALSGLTPREEEVLRLRFFEAKTLRECGEVLGVSANNIRLTEAKALRRLRQSKQSEGLKPYVDFSYQPKEKKRTLTQTAFKEILVYRAPYELDAPVWQETLGERTLSIHEWKGYVIRWEERGASWYINGKTLRTCGLADATRYKTLDDAMVASKVLLSPATSLVDSRILIPERVALFPRQAVPEYDVCRIVGTESYVIHCGYFNQHRFLNQGGCEWGSLEDATKFTDTVVPASLIELAYGEKEGVVFPVCHF